MSINIVGRTFVWLYKQQKTPLILSDSGMKRVDTEIYLNEQAIKGELVIGQSVWRFEAEDPQFVALFPTRSVCSFSTPKELSEPRRKAIFDIISEKVARVNEAA